MNTCPSTQPKASGTSQATSRGSRLPPPPPGRQTRTAQKAARPLTPRNSPPSTPRQPFKAVSPLLLVNTLPDQYSLSVPQPLALRPPTHPVQLSADFSLSSLNVPTLSQLRDYPNLSVPYPPLQPSVIVTLPQSAPSSPIPAYCDSPFADIQPGNPFTPTRSKSPEVSVIQANPGFLPVPPPLPPRCSTPASSVAGGSWDNYLDDPTYQGFDLQFWSTRNSRQIQLVSTDISDLENFSEPSELSSELLNRGQLNTSVISDLEILSDQEVTATTMSTRTAAETNLRSQDTRIRDMCDDLDPDFITEDSAPFMKEKLKEISDRRDIYRDAVRQFLSDFATDLITVEVEQWKVDMKGVVDLVKKHMFDVLGKVTRLAVARPMTEFEKATIKLQEKDIELKQLDSDSKRNEALAVAKPLKKLVEEKCTELEEELDQIPVTELETGDEQQVIRTMQKLAGWKLQAESIGALYQEFLTRTALYPLPIGEQSKVAAAVARTKSALSAIVNAAEEEDLKRQLYSLDTSNRGEQVKWPGFSGEVGEDFFKFKKDFIDAAKQNQTSIRNQQ